MTKCPAQNETNQSRSVATVLLNAWFQKTAGKNIFFDKFSNKIIFYKAADKISSRGTYCKRKKKEDVSRS